MIKVRARINTLGKSVSKSIFDYSGIASLDDLGTDEWRSLFSGLEKVQQIFSAARPHVPEYPWPKDPLHNCIRVWEYPFVYHHLQTVVARYSQLPMPTIVDLGSGATFFPFAVAQLGCRVIAVDADQRAKLSFDRAVGKVPCGTGEATFKVSDARAIELGDESVDCIYCISVLEHITDFERVVSEAGRILRSNGIFILTFDIDLRGNFDLGPKAYDRLMHVLRDDFLPSYPERIVHPLRMLNSDNSIYPMYPHKSILGTIISPIRSMKDRLLNRGATQGRLLVSTYGVCLSKRGPRTLV